MSRRGLEISGPSESIDRFHQGTLPPSQLEALRFRTNADTEWAEHPQVAFLGAQIEPLLPLPGADLVWQQVLIGSPCGDLHIWHRFEDGRKSRSGLGNLGDAEVRTTMDYRRVLGLMDGSMDTLEALEDGGHVEGEWSAMLLLLGIAEQEEFIAAMRRAVGDLGPGLRAITHGRTSARR